jgi:hypothetical protein
MRLIEVSEKQLLALKAVVHGCNTNKRLVMASYMSNIRSEKPEMISYYEAIKTVDEMLSQPTIEAEPVRHGRWRIETDDEEPNPMFKVVECSNCRLKNSQPKPYCPNCGAKMGGDQNGA